MEFKDGDYEILEEKILSKEEKADHWKIGVGLQATDGLHPSPYLIELANAHIEGKYTYEEIADELKRYHSENKEKYDPRTSEADIVATRISEILSRDNFTFGVATLFAYHKQLFRGIEAFHFPIGVARQYNISKKQAVLGYTVPIKSDTKL